MFRRRPESGGVRYCLIDAIRGFAVVNMIVYHLCYDLFCYYSLNRGFGDDPVVTLWERTICFTFILTAGVSMNFSRHGYRRGLTVLLGGFALTVITLIFLPSEIIWFGALGLLGCAILIAFALRKLLAKIEPTPGAGVSLLLFALLYGVPQGYIGFFGAPIAALPDTLYRSPYLAFLGLPPKSFFSADYFPLAPWLFLFLFG